MVNELMKRCPTSYVTRELQTKTVKTYLLQWPKSRAMTPPSAAKGAEHQELSFIAVGNAKWDSHFRRQFCSSLLS